MDHEYWVYIVASRTGTLYIGMTNNLYGRMLEHKSANTKALSASTDATVWFTEKASMMF
jgi:predicted GIY-YIG superfamily endonuclease